MAPPPSGWRALFTPRTSDAVTLSSADEAEKTQTRRPDRVHHLCELSQTCRGGSERTKETTQEKVGRAETPGVPLV